MTSLNVVKLFGQFSNIFVSLVKLAFVPFSKLQSINCYCSNGVVLYLIVKPSTAKSAFLRLDSNSGKNGRELLLLASKGCGHQKP